MAHLGVIKKLIEKNTIPDLIVGTSIGAVVGGMYAQTLDIDYVESRIAEVVERFGTKAKWLGFLERMESVDREDFFHDISNYIKKHVVQLKALTAVSLEEKNVLYGPIREFFRDENIERCRIPFAAVSIDLKSGRQVILNAGSIINAAYASAAVQGVFPPLEYDNMLLADGGPVAMVPVEAAKKLGARRIIAVDVSAGVKDEDSFPTGLQVILRSDLVSQDRLKKFDLDMADLVITPEVQSVHWADFGKIDFCVKRGLAAAEKAMRLLPFKKPVRPWWKRLLPLHIGEE